MMAPRTRPATSVLNQFTDRMGAGWVAHVLPRRVAGSLATKCERSVRDGQG